MPVSLIPNKFLCRYELKLGAKVYAIFMIIVVLACIIAAVVDMLTFTPCEESQSVKRSSYAFCIITIIYSVVMVCVHLWFFWAINKNKASVVLVWVTVTGLWLVQTTVLTIVLLCLYIAEASFLNWIMCLTFAILAFIIFLYGLLVGYGLWVEIKSQSQPAAL